MSFFRAIIVFGALFVSSGLSATGAKPELEEIGSRGFYLTVGPYALFDAQHPTTEISVPETNTKPPVIIYAHGGAGFRADDRARVEMLRSKGFATISFDAYEMNNLDWKFVTREVANLSKQTMIGEVLRGAIEYTTEGERPWDQQNIFL